MGQHKETLELTLPVFYYEKKQLRDELEFMVILKDRTPDQELDSTLTDFFNSMMK
jgi:hypothetical protein